MSWYELAKTAQYQIDSFFDRNVVNDRIRALSKMAEDLTYLGDLVFQSASEAQKRLVSIMEDKKLSSFPDLKGELKFADKVVFDSPWKFSEICHFVADGLMKKVKKLERERKAYVDGLDPDKAYKGLRF